ncbi:MAG: XTP/dITP diphosphatase [bacterium]
MASTLVFATRNRGKLSELRALVKPLGLEVVSAADLGAPDVEEDGLTFEANAAKKALEVSAAVGQPSLADDSGLVVEALRGAPGVRSARFAGPDADDRANNERLLELLRDVPTERRQAHFVCVMAFADPHGTLGEHVELTRGRCNGLIAEAPQGAGGFGYDPLFWVPERGQTFAELPADVKNTISHRAMAMRLMQSFLKRYFH